MDDESPEATSDAAWAATIRGGAYPALAVGALAATVAAAWGWRAVVGATLGALLTVGAFVVGPLVVRSSARWSPPAVMLAAVLAYGVSVLVLGLAFLVLARVGWLSQTAVGVAIFACSTAWLIGHIRAATRLRVLAFGAAAQPLPGEDVAGHPGSS
jgi:Na+-transporting NADH:ubiquinone oxidoreductase subunit NqrB